MVVFRLTYANRTGTLDQAHDMLDGDINILDLMDRCYKFRLNECIWIVPGTYNFD